VNIESVLFASPESRTTLTASATTSPTPSPIPSGVTENATSTDTQSHPLSRNAYERTHEGKRAQAWQHRPMRVLVQRVSSAMVSVDQQVVGSIRPDRQGLLALIGVTHGDDIDKAQRLAEKLWQLRILDGDQSAADIDAPILVVSQFTLYADTAKGRRPSWNAAAPGAVAEPLVAEFARALQRLGAHVQTGVFGAHMQVELINDGPVTVLLEL
jgi:D-tyrosyl-tRNA(Tyr) deacylase